ARKSFEAWSGLLEEELNIRQELAWKEVTELLDADTFACIDKAILSELLHHTVRNTQPIHLLEGWIGRRKNRFFSEAYKQTYGAIGYALQLMEAIRKLDVEVASPAAGFKGYATRWYLTDRLYRNYVLAAQQSEYPDSLKPLSEEVEKMYGNTYLLRLGDNWQAAIRNLTRWGVEGQVPRQRDFYKQWVQPYIEKNNRIFVIISDALRYESATELRERIASEDRFTANITATLGVIPSYTQLGMAAMLPHRELTFDNHSDTVFVDGISSQGTANRTRILQQAFDKSVAIGAEDFLNLKAAGDGREFAKQYQVIYIYSNTIDKTGDDKNSESEVFRATETEFDHLIRIVKQIANMNGNNILITADHGYIYQNRKIEETDFTDFTPEGEVYKCNRRFVIGRDLAEGHAVKRWDGDAIGLADDTQVLTANSINRIRVQGAGSRFVHGGCSLQEIVVPVIEVTKNRKSDLSQVEVDVIGGAVNITGNIFPVSFYQTGPVSEKVQPRTLRGAFYSADGVQLSDSVSFTFDSADNDSGKREKRHTFSFGSDASRYNRQEIYLRLDEVIEGTTQMRAYKSLSYRVMIAFSSEFDFD
ncbi:MAG: BREX-1 system phosphatase PglZ type A, partial [Bacteroidales bacterium]